MEQYLLNSLDGTWDLSMPRAWPSPLQGKPTILDLLPWRIPVPGSGQGEGMELPALTRAGDDSPVGTHPWGRAMGLWQGFRSCLNNWKSSRGIDQMMFRLPRSWLFSLLTSVCSGTLTVGPGTLIYLSFCCGFSYWMSKPFSIAEASEFPVFWQGLMQEGGRRWCLY